MTMKVLMLGTLPYPIAEDRTGGVAEVVSNLVREFATDERVELNLFATNVYARPGVDLREDRDGYVLHRNPDLSNVDDIGRTKKLWYYQSLFGSAFLRRLPTFTRFDQADVDTRHGSTPLFLAIRRVCDEVNPDLIHAHHALDLPITVYLATKGRVPIVTTLHSFHALLGKEGDELERTRQLIKRSLEVSSRMIANSDYVRGEAIDMGVDPDDVVVIPNGIDLGAWEPIRTEVARARLGYPLERTMVLFTGNLERRKGVDLLLDAVATLKDEFEDAALVVVGDGEERERLERQARDLDLGDRVLFTGRVSFDDLRLWYNACDIYCAPSREEAFGIVYLEAMACGKPVVGPNTGGPREIVSDGETGLLFEVEDSQDLAGKLRQLLGDMQQAREMGAEGRRVVEGRYSWEAIAQRTLDLYEETLDASRTD